MNRDILKLAIPSIISNISIPLLTSIDTALVGHLEETYYLGGVAVGGIIFSFIFWGFGFLRMGTTGLTAQAYGEQNRVESIHILLRALLVAILGGLFLLLFQWFISSVAFRVVEASPEVEEQARIYYYIRIWSAPAVLALYALQGWFLGMQNAKYPMVLAIFVNLTTVILDVFFLRVLGMKTKGVALGWVIANYAGVLVACGLFLFRYREYLSKIVKTRVLEWSSLKRFLNVNRDIFLRTLLLILAYTFFTAKSAEEGDTVLAANTILMQLWMILAYGVDGFAFAAESLTGRFFGAKDKENLGKVVRLLFYWALGLSLIVAVGYLAFGRQIVGLFTDKEDVTAAAMLFFTWTILAPIVNAVCFMWDGVFIGATATRPMVISMALATLIFYLPVYYLTHAQIGNHALWLGMTTFMAVRGIALTLYARRAVFQRF